MQVNRLPVLDSTVAITATLQPRSIREEASRNSLLNGLDIGSAARANGDLDAIAQLGELVADVAGARETTLL
jgi:hypothetical protein